MKSIKNYEGRYSATENGEIYSHLTEKILSPKVMKNGYLRVGLVDTRGVTTGLLVHRLVCEAYYGWKVGDVNHLDCNKQNNRPENLEWCSRKENMRHASVNGLLARQSIRMSKMNKYRCSIPVVCEDVYGNRTRYSSMSEAENDGFQHGKISLCIAGMRKTHGCMKWSLA